jgi:hypothetical protein
MQRRRAGILAALGLLLPVATLAAPVTVGVEVSGPTLGMDRPALERYCADEMERLGLAGWHFVPAEEAPNGDSIDFKIVLNPYAGGTNRYIGPLSTPGLGLHRSISVEARLSLGGRYQTLSFVQGEVGGARDPALGRLVTGLTRSLLDGADTSLPNGVHPASE